MQFRFLAACAALLLTTPGMAQDETDEYLRLATTLTDDALSEQSFEIAIQIGFKGVLEADEEMVALETECPGLISTMAEAARPVMWELHQRDNLDYRTALHKLFARRLSREEAAGGAGFFASPLGKRFVYTLQLGISADNVIADVVSNEDMSISRGSLERDTRTSALRGILALSPEDRKELTRLFSSEDWARAFSRIQPEVTALQHKLVNQDYPPEDHARIDASVQPATIAHFEKCDDR
ncbi:hypothetical protein [Parerythrobacter lacustris]|uniref:DUF2059 domain-containing protein n=1 Tax=Parerythrobacter lacustris TaxID=2969984 RepID=A0ABT1XQY6_9SPHN|nr:hypothetical protein [Parerythrobacter lacustris]MCR2832862.1 hypothetical protein [Parerythrobacter lacustris]